MSEDSQGNLFPLKKLRWQRKNNYIFEDVSPFFLNGDFPFEMSVFEGVLSVVFWGFDFLVSEERAVFWTHALTAEQGLKGSLEPRMMPVDQACGVFWQWHSAGQFPWRTAPTPHFLGKSLCLKAYTPQIAKKICIKVLNCPPLMTIPSTSKF